MTLVDYAVLAIIGFSVLLSVIRGMVREILALAAWIIAALAVWLLGDTVAAWMPAEIPGDELKWLTGAVLLFITVLLAMSLVAVAVGQLVKSAGLGVEDRLLGAVFGLVRGAAVVTGLALLAGTTALPAQQVWREAALRPLLEMAAKAARGWLPAELSQHIKYG